MQQKFEIQLSQSYQRQLKVLLINMRTINQLHADDDKTTKLASLLVTPLLLYNRLTREHPRYRPLLLSLGPCPYAASHQPGHPAASCSVVCIGGYFGAGTQVSYSVLP